jgi:phosphohistidine phosphatase
MRHAKSDWDADYGDDHDRPLNRRGTDSARLMGRILTERGLAPGLVISSTAVRARTTAQLAIEAGSWTADLILDRRLYESGPDGVLEVAAAAPDVERLMLVGHQPTWSMLVRHLTGEGADMKTASVAGVELAANGWEQLASLTGDLSFLLHPSAVGGER